MDGKRQVFRPDWTPDMNLSGLASGLVAISLILGLLYVGQDVLIPLAIAFLISFALSPLVRVLVRRGVPRIAAVSAVMAALVMALAGLTMLIVAQLGTLSAELPTYQSTIRSKIQTMAEEMERPGLFDGLMRTVDTVREEVGAAVSSSDTQPAPMPVTVVPDSTAPIRTAVAWLAPILAPLATLGIVFVFVFLVLLDQGDLRDRLLRILGGNLHRSTDAMAEAGRRISRYLLMQVVVNVTYAVPMAAGLWLIGVPGFILWGTLAALMRFIPYVGPILSAVFPLTLAFAVDPGWNMVLMAAGLIILLELISNNIVEPILYGTSTGLSALSLIAAATFWTAMWGPIGLILSTPLTVCLLVVGRNIPQLQVLETLLGSGPALDVPTRIYQRLIADDVEEAIDIAATTIDASSLLEFYDDDALEVLRRASADHLSNARPEHRLRIVNGMELLLADLEEDYPPQVDPLQDPRVVCIGGKWGIDDVSCHMLTHALATEGVPAVRRAAGVLTPHYLDKLQLDGIQIVCVTYFSPNPERSVRAFCQRLRQRWPGIHIVLGLWNVDDPSVAADWGADHVATSVGEAQQRIQKVLEPWLSRKRQIAEPPEDDAGRVLRLEQTGILDNHLREKLDSFARRAAEVFDADLAVISAIHTDQEFIVGQSKELPGARDEDHGGMIAVPRSEAVCDHVVSTAKTLLIRDTHRDPRFTDHPTLEAWHTRFYAGAPIRTEDGRVLGALCLLGAEPRDLTAEEEDLLEALASEVAEVITGEVPPQEEPEEEADDASATTAQLVPQ